MLSEHRARDGLLVCRWTKTNGQRARFIGKLRTEQNEGSGFMSFELQNSRKRTQTLPSYTNGTSLSSQTCPLLDKSPILQMARKLLPKMIRSIGSRRERSSEWWRQLRRALLSSNHPIPFLHTHAALWQRIFLKVVISGLLLPIKTPTCIYM